MPKNIKELTLEEGRQILAYVYPHKNFICRGLSFEVVPDENGRVQVSMDLRPLVGVLFHNGQDNCILHFEHTKVVQWLYQNGYDITAQLEANKNHSDIEADFEDFVTDLNYEMAEGNPALPTKINALLDKYYYKEYE